MHIRVVSRFDLHTGIGWHGWSFLKVLSLVPGVKLEAIVETNRLSPEAEQLLQKYCFRISHWNEAEGLSDFSIYCNVLEQQKSLKNLNLGKINTAYTVFDSDRVPPSWVQICKKHLDFLLVTDPFVRLAFENSGLDMDIFEMPMVIKPIKNQVQPKNEKPRFTFIGTDEERKNVDMLIDAFTEAFTADEADLHVHISETRSSRQNLHRLVKKASRKNILFSYGNLLHEAYEAPLAASDCFISISAGEGFSLIPREFMHLGRPLILSHAGAHRSIPSMEGLWFIKSKTPVAARYPHIFGNETHGHFFSPEKKDVVSTLKRLLPEIKKKKTYPELQKFARCFSPETLSLYYATIFCPKIVQHACLSEINSAYQTLHLKSKDLIKKYGEQGFTRSYLPESTKKHIVLANDGGFFSIFNRLVSILTHKLEEDEDAVVIPDWRVSAMKKYYGHDQFISFCYGSQEDGNIYLKLFQPLKFDVTPEQYNDPDYLRDQVCLRIDFNTEKEPNLTYIYAYDLYKDENFQSWREKYHKYFKKHIILREDLQEKINLFKKKFFDGNYVIAAHIRHPSHASEQPGKQMPGLERFKELIDQQITLAEESQNKPVKVFIATDQDSVLHFFQRCYQDRLISTMSTRTSKQYDSIYQSRGEEGRLKEGLQIHHIMASHKRFWNTNMADEVIIDAWLLAAADKLIHVTSNISTAVSYMNPKIEMIYCE